MVGGHDRGMVRCFSPHSGRRQSYNIPAYLGPSLCVRNSLSCSFARSSSALCARPAMSAGKTKSAPYRPPHARRGSDSVLSLNIREWAKTEMAHSEATHVSAPTEVACFSRFDDRRIQFGSRAELKQFRDPPMNVNLGDGFNTYIPKDEREFNGVEPIVECLHHAGYDLDSQVDIVTYRNNLNKIGNAPYNYRDPFEFDAVMVGRTCFLDIRKLEERTPDAQHQRFMYMGYRFEALCTGHDLRRPVNANAEFCAVMRTRIGGIRIALCAEVDGEIEGTSAQGKTPYVEMKTTKKPASDRDYRNLYLMKYQKWFVQSYLAGIRTLFIGLRDPGGRLVDVAHVSTWSLHRTAKQFVGESPATGGDRAKHDHCWEPFVSINCIAMICENVARVCGDNSEQTIRFAFNPESGTLTGRLVADEPAKSQISFADRIRRLQQR